jgi:ankyrin repeat protein
MNPRRISLSIPPSCRRPNIPDKRCFSHGRSYERLQHGSFIDIQKFIENNRFQLNKKNSRGKTPFFFLVNDLPKKDVTFQTIERVVNCLIQNSAHLHEEQFLHGSAFTHLMSAGNFPNAAYLANLLIDYGKIDPLKLDEKGHSPLYRTAQAIVKKDFFALHKCLIPLIKKWALVKPAEYPYHLPYHDLLSTQVTTESGIKSLYLTLFLFTRLEKSTLNAIDSSGQTPFDLALLIDSESPWKEAILTLLIEKGARPKKFPLPKIAYRYPTLGDFYHSRGPFSNLCFSHLLK